MRGQRHAPAALYPRERPGTHCTEGWVGPRAGLDRCGKSRPTRIRSPDRPARSQSLYRLSYPRKTGTLHENLCAFLIMSRSVPLGMKNVSDKIVQKIKTQVSCSITFLFGNRAVYEIMWKNVVERGRPQMAI